MNAIPPKNKFAIKYKNIKNIERYLNSRHWVIFSTEKYLTTNNQIYSLYNIITNQNYREIFDRAQINTKVLLIGVHNDIIMPYRELQSRNIKVYMMNI